MMDRLTWTSPAEAESDFWLTRTSLAGARTSPDNPSWVKLDDPDLFGWVWIGPG
jgi:hypothetical protein